MVGVLSVVFLSMLDQTIVGTAMPRIVADLQGFDVIVWVSTAYLLTSTVPIPIFGKLSDLFGRKPIMLFGIVVFLAGSALCGAVQTMNQLIAFRALQGLGAAALQPIAIAIIGDLFPPRERGKWQGVSGSTYGLAASILSAFDNPLILLSPDAPSRVHAGFAGYGAQGTEAFNLLLQAVKTGLAQSVHNVFALSLVVILFGFIAVFFLKEIPLRERKTANQKPEG